MKRALIIFALISIALQPVAHSASRIPAADDATIYRDEFGIPHVFASTLENAAYAIGYAQAEDRLEELLKNYRRANGSM